MFRLSSNANESTLEVRELEVAEGECSPGDVRLSVTVQSHGFTGGTDVWVMRAELNAFTRALNAVNMSLAGSATLRSVSPDELDLRVVAVSSRGHLAAQGSLGYHVYEREAMYWHSVTFGFEFEPSQLEAAVKAKWGGKSAA